MKVAWLSQYPIHLLQEKIDCKIRRKTHPSSWIVNLSNELAKRPDIDLHIITLSPYVNKNYRFCHNNINFHILQSFYKIPFLDLGLPNYIPLGIISDYAIDKYFLDKELKRINPDIVHIHGTESSYGLSDYAIHKPHILSIQGIMNEIAKYDKIPAKTLKREINLIKKYHYFGNRTKFGDDFISKHNPNAKIHYLPEAINEIFFTQSNCKEKNLVFVGDIIERKGINILLHSFNKLKSQFPDLKLRIIGNDCTPYAKRLKKMYFSSDINWLGHCDPIKIKQIFDDSSIFVLPSFMENSPNSLLEAMASGLICIASNAGGIPDIITDKHNGFLFEINDFSTLSNIINNILSDKKKFIDLTKNSTNDIYNNNHPKNVGIKIINVYKNIINKYNVCR